MRRTAASELSQGFTLLEVLVAVVLIALVYTMAFGYFRDIQRAYTRISEGQGRSRAARVILDRLEQELGGAILLRRAEGEDPLAHPWVFYAEDGAIDGNPADRVRFVTQTPLRAAGERIGRGLRVVTYGVDADLQGRAVLLRKEEELPDQLVKAIDLSDAQVVAEGIHSFELSWGSSGESFQGWDSTSIEQTDQTPEVVQVSLQLWERDANGEFTAGPPITRVIELAVRPEYLEAPGGADSGSCTTGASTRECMQRWLPVLSQYSPDTQEHFGELFSAVKDACWNPPNPSSELVELQRQLRQAIRLSAGQSVPECELPK